MIRKGRQARLGSVLEGALRRLDRKNGGAYASARALAAWEKVSGQGIAKHTTGAHLRNGALVVYVDNNGWATEYTAMAEQYRRAVNQEAGEELVTSVRFIVSRKVAEEQQTKRSEERSEQFYQEDEVSPVPLSDVELAQLRSSVRDIPDAELQEAVLRATIRDLEWKKGIAARNEAQAPRDEP